MMILMPAFSIEARKVPTARYRVPRGRAGTRAEAFLLDEPFSNLDVKLRTSMRTGLIKLHRALSTNIVHATHN